MKRKILIPVLTIFWLVGVGMLFYVMYAIKGLDYLLSKEGMNILTNGLLFLAVGTIFLVLALRTSLEDMAQSIKHLTKEARLFARGEYAHMMRSSKIEEIEELMVAFDTMGEKMHRNIRKLQYQKTKAESVLHTLHEGIIILDEEGYVLEINEFASTILGQVVGKNTKIHITSILRDTKCKNIFKKAQQLGEYTECEIIFEDKMLYIGVRPMQKATSLLGYIVVIRNTTEIRRLEQLRYQFVSNVTHEIKTPLTSIQGFVETLQDGAIENPIVAKRFLDIIEIETKRLYRLIQDILALSEIENMENHYEETAILPELINNVINLLAPQAEEKGIILRGDRIEDISLEKVNKDHISQLIVNLVGNAIRYTDKGEITINCYQIEETKIISIKDTGIGIPADSIPHIFERFYRVDKGRSRKNGGTGLGLSIVKHLVQLYNGKIEVESKLGKGSCFVIKF